MSNSNIAGDVLLGLRELFVPAYCEVLYFTQREIA